MVMAVVVEVYSDYSLRFSVESLRERREEIGRGLRGNGEREEGRV